MKKEVLELSGLSSAYSYDIPKEIEELFKKNKDKIKQKPASFIELTAKLSYLKDRADKTSERTKELYREFYKVNEKEEK